MEQQNNQIIIDKLYDIYLDKGFLLESEALDLMTERGISLVGVNRITDKLLAKGVIFSDTSIVPNELSDYAQLDYKEVFKEVLQISPAQKQFIEYVVNIKPPQYREWRLLIPQMNSGNRYAFNRLFDMYLRVAVKIALQIHKDTNFELDDAIQDGAIGIIKALQTYDINENGSLSSYVPLWIKQNITRAISNTGNTIRIPTHAYEKFLGIESFKKEYHSLNCVFPVIEEIAKSQNCSVDTVEQILFAMQDGMDIDYLAEDDNLGNILYESGNYYYVEDEVYSSRLAFEVKKSIQKLTVKEQRVLILLYGLGGGIQRTLEDVGNEYGVTRERIRQIEAKALRKLRRPSTNRNLIDFY